MNMQKFLRNGAVVLAFLYAMSAMPLYADLCFLGSGDCGDDDGLNGERRKTRTCDEYKAAGNYYTSPQLGKNCDKVNIDLPGCVLYSCFEASCRERDYVLGPTNSLDVYPKGRDASDWKCKSCQEGDKYWWTCEPKLCDGGTVLSSNCDLKNHDFVKISKSGFDDCGFCNAKQVVDISLDNNQGAAAGGSNNNSGDNSGTSGTNNTDSGTNNNTSGNNTSSGQNIYNNGSVSIHNSYASAGPGNTSGVYTSTGPGYTSGGYTSTGPNYVMRMPTDDDDTSGSGNVVAGARGDGGEPSGGTISDSGSVDGRIHYGTDVSGRTTLPVCDTARCEVLNANKDGCVSKCTASQTCKSGVCKDNGCPEGSYKTSAECLEKTQNCQQCRASSEGCWSCKFYFDIIDSTGIRNLNNTVDRAM